MCCSCGWVTLLLFVNWQSLAEAWQRRGVILWLMDPLGCPSQLRSRDGAVWERQQEEQQQQEEEHMCSFHHLFCSQLGFAQHFRFFGGVFVASVSCPSCLLLPVGMLLT